VAQLHQQIPPKTPIFNRHPSSGANLPICQDINLHSTTYVCVKYCIQMRCPYVLLLWMKSPPQKPNHLFIIIRMKIFSLAVVFTLSSHTAVLILKLDQMVHCDHKDQMAV
jgi:hypothetical protein